MKKIAVIGSTGSIGRQAIEVAMRAPTRFKIVALVAGSSNELLTEQVERVKPLYAALRAGQLTRGSAVKFFSGEEAGLTVLEECGADVALIACSGFEGLKYSLKAASLGMDIALANKESLVCGGELLMPRVKNLMPVDSEHCAIWQCLGFDLNAPFERLIITASGGAFRGRRWEDLKGVTPEEALAHPTWKMGAKITVDSATLLNKGYEVIEAHHLFAAPFERISTIIHPQSIIHSMVQFKGGATLAQLSYPSMQLPIALALGYPERVEGAVEAIDFNTLSSLTFQKLERSAYPMYDLAITCGEEGGVMPTVLNAASEVAVNAFLCKKIAFTDIYGVVDKVVQGTAGCGVESLAQLTQIDGESRARALKIIDGV